MYGKGCRGIENSHRPYRVSCVQTEKEPVTRFPRSRPSSGVYKARHKRLFVHRAVGSYPANADWAYAYKYRVVVSLTGRARMHLPPSSLSAAPPPPPPQKVAMHLYCGAQCRRSCCGSSLLQYLGSSRIYIGSNVSSTGVTKSYLVYTSERGYTNTYLRRNVANETVSAGPLPYSLELQYAYDMCVPIVSYKTHAYDFLSTTCFKCCAVAWFPDGTSNHLRDLTYRVH